MDTINLLAALDENYLPQLGVLLTSINLNNPGTRFNLYLLHSNIPNEAIEAIHLWNKQTDNGFFPIRVQSDLFEMRRQVGSTPRRCIIGCLQGRCSPII